MNRNKRRVFYFCPDCKQLSTSMILIVSSVKRYNYFDDKYKLLSNQVKTDCKCNLCSRVFKNEHIENFVVMTDGNRIIHLGDSVRKYADIIEETLTNGVIYQGEEACI